jgi:hypothetical protein
VYIKPNNFVVLDNVILRNTIMSGAVKEVRWNAHFKNQPQVSGQIINTQVPGHIETFNGKNYVEINSSAYININTVYPDSTLTKRIGGTGYEYWVNGTNYPPSGNPDSVYATAGKWRIEVIPKLSLNSVFSDTVNMLHTLSVNDVGIPPEQIAVKIKNETTLGCDYLNKLFLFNDKGDTGTVSLAANGIPGSRTVSLFCFDLKRNSSYSLFVDGININEYTADSTGIILKQIYLSPGNHNILMVLSSVKIPEQNSLIPGYYMLYPNFPNPFNSSTKISFDIPKEIYVKIVLYDVSGKVVMEIINSNVKAGKYTQTIRTDNLSSGVYYIKLESAEHKSTMRIVLLK